MNNEKEGLLNDIYSKRKPRSPRILLILSLVWHKNTAGSSAGGKLMNDWDSSSRSVKRGVNEMSHMRTCWKPPLCEDVPDAGRQASNDNIGLRTRLQIRTSGFEDG